MNQSRRDFLKAGLATGVGLAAMGADLAVDVDASSARRPIATRPFGRTGRVLPILGIGSSPLVARWARGYGARPRSVEERAALVRHAYDCGVRYFDTARSYYEAEEVMGHGLKGVAQDCVIASKVTVLKPENVRRSVETSLATLGVDRIEVMQIHSSGAIERLGFEGAMKVHAELVKLRGEGVCRYIGLTTHVAFETAYKMIATGGFDQALLAYCYFPKGMDTLLSERNLQFREMCLEKAHKLGTAVVAMKVMGASIFGRMSRFVVPDYNPVARRKLPGAAMRWVMNDERVSLMVIGMGYAEEVEQNAAILASDLTLTDEDRALLADYSARAHQSERIKKMRVV